MEPEFRSMAEQRRHEWLLEQRDKMFEEPIIKESLKDEPRIFVAGIEFKIEARPPRRHWEITINLSNATAEDRDYFCDFLEPILLGYDKVHPGHDIDMSSQLSEDQ